MRWDGAFVFFVSLIFLHHTAQNNSDAASIPYANPLVTKKCAAGGSVIRLKVSGVPSKICAPPCASQGSACPDAPGAQGAVPTCVSVSKRKLCILKCLDSTACPTGTTCHKTGTSGLCIFTGTTASSAAKGVAGAAATKSATRSSTHTKKAPTRTMPRRLPLDQPRSFCNDACRFAKDGYCEDGGESSSSGLCAIGSDCSDCGVRMLIDEWPSRHHTVRRGETLVGIGQPWGLRGQTLQLWNRIGSASKLEAGQKIILTRAAYIASLGGRLGGGAAPSAANCTCICGLCGRTTDAFRRFCCWPYCCCCHSISPASSCLCNSQPY